MEDKVSRELERLAVSCQKNIDKKKRLHDSLKTEIYFWMIYGVAASVLISLGSPSTGRAVAVFGFGTIGSITLGLCQLFPVKKAKNILSAAEDLIKEFRGV